MASIATLQQIFGRDNDNFLQLVYQEFLGRNPDPTGRQYFSNYLQQGGARYSVLTSMLNSPEFEQLLVKPLRARPRTRAVGRLMHLLHADDHGFITGLYQEVLLREPQGDEVAFHVNLLKQGLSRSTIIRSFLSSPEFIRKVASKKRLAPQHQSRVVTVLRGALRSKRSVFVTSLYRQLFGATPGLKHRRRYNRILHASGSRFKVLQVMIQEPMFQQQFNNQMFTRIHNILRHVAGEDDRTFVVSLYREFLSREPDTEGLQTHLNLLRAAGKAAVVRSVLASEEAKQLIENTQLLDQSEPLPPVWNHLWPHVPIDYGLRKHVANTMKGLGLSFESHILVCSGGLGDFVQLTAVAKALKAKDPSRPVVTVTNYAEVYEEHPYIDAAIQSDVYDMTKIKSVIGLTENVFDIRYVSRAYGTWQPPQYFHEHQKLYENYRAPGWMHDELHKHVVEQMLYSLGLETYANSEDTYVTPAPVAAPISGNYVVVNDAVGSKPGELKRWRQEEWEKLLDWLINQGILPVQLGFAVAPLLSKKVLDLRGKTTTRQAATYLKNSLGYIGVEGGLFHLSKAVGAPAVVIFSSTSPETFAYSDTYVTRQPLCQPCWWTESWQHFHCMYHYPSCINLPSAEQVADTVSEMLSHRRGTSG